VATTTTTPDPVAKGAALKTMTTPDPVAKGAALKTTTPEVTTTEAVA